MKYKCFVILPYNTEYDAIWSVLNSLSAKFKTGNRIDFIRTDQNILMSTNQLDINRHISQCDFVVADISNLNPNVLYEVGYATALEKPIVLLKNKSANTEIPANLFGRYVVEYNLDTLDRLNFMLPPILDAAIESLQLGRPTDTFVATGYSNELSSDMLSMIGNANWNIDIMVINLSHLIELNFLNEIIGAIVRSELLKARFMAIDPESKIVNDRAQQLAKQVSYYRKELRQSLDKALSMTAQVADRCTIRLYNELPFYNMYRFDDIVFLGLLVSGSSSRGGTVFRLKRSHPGMENIIGTFERAWDSSATMYLPNK